MNIAVFDNKLPAPKSVTIRNFRDDTCGNCLGLNNQKYKLRFKQDFENRKEFLTVLVHEMVHSYEWIHYGTMLHGNNFNAFKEIVFKRVGLPLSRLID
jgi:hypothetical protein